MVKTLFNTCLSALCQHELKEDLAYIPTECKMKLLEFFTNHNQLLTLDCNRLVQSPFFGLNLTELSFYLSEDLTDATLVALTLFNKRLERITLVECPRVTDEGILAATRGQCNLRMVELRAMAHLSDKGLAEIRSDFLHTVDVSGCCRVTSTGVRCLVSRNPSIHCFFLNHCKAIDDQALYDIAYYVGDQLVTLELDFLASLRDPAAALHHLSSQCPNLKHLSLARFFNEEETELVDSTNPYQIDGVSLQDVDLYGNYFATLPVMPPTVCSIRLSVSGDEDPFDLIRSLEAQPYLRSINLQLGVRDGSIQAIDNANGLLRTILPYLGSKITKLQVEFLNDGVPEVVGSMLADSHKLISVPRLFDDSLNLLIECTPNLTHLALAVNHLSTHVLQKYFAGGSKSRGAKLRSLKICRMRMTYRVLFAIARGARNLTDLETSHMYSVDDRFLTLLADNCKQLRCINVNGCKWVTDKGLASLARKCPLREVRIRATACTDKSLYTLAQFCPELEWISYSDFSGRPKFTEEALQCLRDSCIQKVIC